MLDDMLNIDMYIILKMINGNGVTEVINNCYGTIHFHTLYCLTCVLI